MNSMMKRLAIGAITAGLWCGFGLAVDYEGFGETFVAEDTTREIVTTLHSRLDAFRKVRLVETADPAAATLIVTDAAYGSLTLPAYSYDSRTLNRFWGGGLGTWQNAGTRGNIEGYKYDGQGAILGYDRAFGALTIGGAASYVEGDYENKEATKHDLKIKQYSGNLYATYNNSRGFFFTVTGGYTYSDNELRETYGVNVDTEDFGMNTWNAGGRMGFDFEPTSTIVITPSIGANFFHSSSRDHNLAANGVDVSRTRGVSHNMVEIPLDVQVAKEFTFGANRVLQLAANGGYAYNLNDRAVSGEATDIGGANPEYFTGRKLGHHAWKGGLGARLKMEQWDVGVKYDYLGRSNYNSHRVMGTIGFSF